ncbi:MAG: acyl carrier protein [Clostridiales bacterium]|nr:acyl carrier protein [Clostridiales bacterium]
MSEIQDCDDVKNDTLLLERGILDSLSIIYLINELEERLNMTIPLEDVVEDNFKSIESIVEFVLTRINDGLAES